MPDSAKYDLEFRPRTYWPDFVEIRKWLSQVEIEDDAHGTRTAELRREAVELLDSNSFEELEQLLWTHRIETHGGVVSLLGEVTIAFLSFNSRPGSSISLTARPGAGSIDYRVSFDEGRSYNHPGAGSWTPISMAEVIEMLDDQMEGADWMLHLFAHTDDPESLRGFVTADSAFYPGA